MTVSTASQATPVTYEIAPVVPKPRSNCPPTDMSSALSRIGRSMISRSNEHWLSAPAPGKGCRDAEDGRDVLVFFLD